MSAPPAERCEVAVIGAGPGGYTAAFRAADLGKQVVLIERHAALGGVCLNVGCIPSKALLHLAAVVRDARAAAAHGIVFGEPQIDLARVRAFRSGVVDRLASGLAGLARRRKVRVLRGTARFEGANRLRVEGPEGEVALEFEHAIVAAGSRAIALPGLPAGDPRILDSTSALALESIPSRLLVVGGGVIGLELAAVYHAFGSQVDVVELSGQLLPGVDRELVAPLAALAKQRYRRILLGSRLRTATARASGVQVEFEGQSAPEAAEYDALLVAVGRRANGDRLGLEAAGIDVDAQGCVAVDAQLRTQVPHVFALGDLVAGPMLAHKASHQGKVAAEVIAGQKSAFDPLAIPAVAYTDPEVAWMGLGEAEARVQGIEVRVAKFPWAASGRALGSGRSEGLTKLIFDAADERLLGAGVAGPNAGELIGELVLARELGADAEDLARSIHPHPTLAESIGFAAEMALGTITDLYHPRRPQAG